MNTILLATDGSPTAMKATESAIQYAKALAAPLVILSVWDVTYEPMGVAYGPVLPDLDQVGHEQAKKVVNAAAAKAEAAGVEHETLIRRGTPIQQICLVADELGPALIVLGTHGWGAFKRALFGSVSSGVVHHAKSPVLVVPCPEAAEREPAEPKVEATV